MEKIEVCSDCKKIQKLCFCEAIKPVDNRVTVLILRHPQEEDRKLGTAHMATMQLSNSVLRTGLSWANLSKAVGREVKDPKKWGVLYLGTQKTANPLPDQVITVINKKGEPTDKQSEILDNLEGIIALDGNWAQAKALWWRNAWMLKCHRLVLQPPRESFYGNLRKEPRKESVSTIEAISYTLAALDKRDDLVAEVLPPFHLLLKKAKGGK
jgi:DTW domain-containing protein YfiP